jgi:hypothetical protein
LFPLYHRSHIIGVGVVERSQREKYALQKEEKEKARVLKNKAKA